MWVRSVPVCGTCVGSINACLWRACGFVQCLRHVCGFDQCQSPACGRAAGGVVSDDGLGMRGTTRPACACVWTLAAPHNNLSPRDRSSSLRHRAPREYDARAKSHHTHNHAITHSRNHAITRSQRVRCARVKSHHTHALTRSRNHTVTQPHNHNAFLIERYVVAEWAAAEADVAAGACPKRARFADVLLKVR